MAIETTTKETTQRGGARGASQGDAAGKEAPKRRGATRRKVVMKKGGRRGSTEKFRPEFDQKILSIRRVARVVAGGRRFSFSVTLAAGNRKGRVGVGLGKGADTQIAIEKAFNNAKKNMVTLNLTDGMSVPHEVEAKYGSSRVLIMPAPGKGLVAGSAVRSIFELAGMKDVSAKLFSRSKNALNNSRVTILALSQLAPSAKGKTKSEKADEKEERSEKK